MQSCSFNPARCSLPKSSGVVSNRGFTLIELMITVAIVALLASLAYPAYTGSIIKGKRAEGRAALIDLLQQQERYLTQTGSYMTFSQTVLTGSLTGTTQNGTSVAMPFKNFSGDNRTGSAYLLGASQCGSLGRNECVLLTAYGNFTDNEVGNLTLTSTGVKSCTGPSASAPTPKCWR